MFYEIQIRFLSFASRRRNRRLMGSCKCKMENITQVKFHKNTYNYHGGNSMILASSLSLLVPLFLWKVFTRLLKNKNLLTTVEEDKQAKDESQVPLSVNYHFTRKCNYECKFCFHQAKTSFHLPIEEAKRGIKMLVEAGMKKINFSGGEPFIVERGKYVGELVKFSKLGMNIESVTIVSNGSLIKDKWFQEFGRYLDILAISCDSSEPETLKEIGRLVHFPIL